jgi:hypothetical protein
MRATEFLTEAHHSRLFTQKMGKWNVHFDSHFLVTVSARNISLPFVSHMISYIFYNLDDIETIPRGKGAYIQDTNTLISVYIKRSNSYPTDFTIETVLSPDMKPTPPLFRRSFPAAPKSLKDKPHDRKMQDKIRKDVEQKGRDKVSQDLSDIGFKPQLLNRANRRTLSKLAKKWNK